MRSAAQQTDSQAPRQGTQSHLRKGTYRRERIRAELNIEKWPAIWRPSRSTHAPAVRVLEREHTNADGTRVRARVELGFTNLGELTTEDQKTYYALVRQWELAGRPPQQTFFSVRGLAQALRKKWGTNVITAVTESLRRLRVTPITWENAFFDGGRREILEEIETFTVLSELKIIRKKADGHVTKEAGYFRFNDFTLKNLFSHHTKPVLFETILGFRSDLAQLLYTHLDLIMADKWAYERRTRELFGDLGVCGTDYERLYERKRALARAIAEMQGVPLTTGVITRIGVERSADGKDYKLVVAKGSSLFKEAEIAEAVPHRTVAPAPSPVAAQADELVRHFHKVFHGVDDVYPQSKELGHATALVAQHGLDRSRYIVDYAHTAAGRTGYLPQAFGGIMQYASRALAHYEAAVRNSEASVRAREQAKARRAYEELQAEAETKRWKDAEARLANLPADELERLRAKVSAAMATKSRWLPQGESSSLFFRRYLRSAMVAELARLPEPQAEPDPTSGHPAASA